MADWTRRLYSAPGLTQSEPGPYLRAVQAKYLGTVMLCIDVSGSMTGDPLREAIRGAFRFLDEAAQARYAAGVILWDDGITAEAVPERDGAGARRLLGQARIRGGTNLLPALKRCHDILGGRPGDRVVAVFGDGDVGHRTRVLAKVTQMKAEGIRFVTRGLGPVAPSVFGELSSEEPSESAIRDVGGLADGIAGMARSLRVRRDR